MIPKRWIELYLRFLLRNRLPVAAVVAVMTVFFAWQTTRVRVVPGPGERGRDEAG